MKLSMFAMTALLLTGIVQAQSSATPDPVQLMQKVQKQNSPSEEEVQLAMTLIDAGGKISQRTARYYQKQRTAGAAEDMKLIRFSSPAEMNGSAVLTLENEQRSDDQWLFLPAYHTSRKVPASNRSDRYMGTDFFYEDVSNDKISQYKYSIIRQEKLADRQYLVIEQIPQNVDLKRDSAYSKKLQWVDPERLVVARIDYFDKQGSLMKRYEASGSAQIGGRWRWSGVVMSNLKLNHKTTIKYSERKIDAGLDASLFTVRSLEREK